jgi:hypothetical protein
MATASFGGLSFHGIELSFPFEHKPPIKGGFFVVVSKSTKRR